MAITCFFVVDCYRSDPLLTSKSIKSILCENEKQTY